MQNLAVDNTIEINTRWTTKATVFNLLLRMQDVVFLLISTCIWSMRQLFDCGVPGKFQLLQIPETCDKASVLEY